MLQASHITKTYQGGQKVALQDFSLQVPQASIHGLLGPNGAGKTSFIRIINQITRPDSGEIFINGEPLSPKHIQEIGYMPEERGLYKNMTIGDQIVYFGELKGMRKKEAMERAKYWFEKLHIDQWWKKKLSELSKGMAQKIQFVVTVLHQPKLLILDEPFSGFDPVNANLVRDQILDLKEQGTTIILSTHRMESVEQMCDHVSLINRSRKILDGKVLEVRERYKQDIFRVTIENPDYEKLHNFMAIHTIHTPREEGHLYSFELIDIQHQAQIINELSSIGKIRLFEEKIPSMNEVFIQAVQSQNI